MANTTGTSAEGSRPTTDGAVDNIGAGEKFTGKQSPEGVEVTGPGPAEKMQSKRQNAEAVRRDDAAPFGLREDGTSVPNTEPATPEDVIASADPGRRP